MDLVRVILSCIIIPMDPVGAESEAEQSREARKRKAQIMTVIRRVHLYSGLFLAPWVLLFGLSGLLFNHPNLGKGQVVRNYDPDELTELTGFEAIDPADAAAAVAEAVGGLEGGVGLRLDPSYAPKFEGRVLLTASGTELDHRLYVDLERGTGQLKSRPRGTGVWGPSFSEQEIEVPGYAIEAFEPPFRDLLGELELEADTPMKLHPRASPDLRLRLLDAEGRAYNVSYELRSGELRGRERDGPSGMGWRNVIARLHMTHVFPHRVGARFMWVVFADLTALCMIIWAITGLIMWWQLKRLRKIGAVILAAAVLAGVAVFTAMILELTFEGRTTPKPAEQAQAQR